jgi:hypothetical protein
MNATNGGNTGIQVSEQAEQQQKRLYATLALKQIQKAAGVTEQVWSQVHIESNLSLN